MLKLSEEIDRIISTNDFLSVGFGTHLFNLSHLTEFLKPLLERRLRKPLSKGSVLMGLSRLQKKHPRMHHGEIKLFELNPAQNECRIFSNMFAAHFIKNQLTEKQLQLWKKWIETHKGRLWCDEDGELSTFITSVSFLEEMSHVIELKPKRIITNLSVIEFQAPQNLRKRTQLLHQLTWNLELQEVDLIHLHLSPRKIALVLKDGSAKRII